MEHGVAAVARQPVVSYAMRPDKLVLKRTLLVMLHGCSLNRVTKKKISGTFYPVLIDTIPASV